MKKTRAQLDVEIARALEGFGKYRDLPRDPHRGNPLHQWGMIHADKLGTYWTIAVEIPLCELASLRPVMADRARVKSVASARASGVELPPIELGVYRDGSAWIVDGNHRLIDARRAGLASLRVIFTFVGV